MCNDVDKNFNKNFHTFTTGQNCASTYKNGIQNMLVLENL